MEIYTIKENQSIDKRSLNENINKSYTKKDQINPVKISKSIRDRNKFLNSKQYIKIQSKPRCDFIKIQQPNHLSDIEVYDESTYDQEQQQQVQVEEEEKFNDQRKNNEKQQQQFQKLQEIENDLQKKLTSSKNIEDIELQVQMILKCHYHYSKWDESIEMKNKLLQQIETQKKQNLFINEDLLKLDQILNQNKIKFVEIDKDFQVMQQNEQQLKGTDWILNQKKDKISAYYKFNEGLKTVSLKIEGEINASLMNVLSLFYECDLMTKYTPFLEKCNITERKSDKLTQRSAETYINLPLLTRRWSVIEGQGINRFDKNRTILIYLKDIKNKAEEIGVKFQKSLVPMDVCQFIVQIESLSYNRSILTFICNVDLKMKIVPMSFINYISKKFSIAIFYRIEKCATKNFAYSAWAPRILGEKNKIFYEMVNECLLLLYKQNFLEQLRQQVENTKKK